MLTKPLRTLCVICAFALTLGARADVTERKTAEMYKKEKRLDGAAVELFLALREKYGKELLTTGGLIFCRRPDLAEKTQPNIMHLMLDANDILDKLDLSLYGIKKLQDKERMALIRRAVTGTSVYIFSADEFGQTLENMLPEHKEIYCRVIEKSAREIQEKKSTSK